VDPWMATWAKETNPDVTARTGPLELIDSARQS
jgi:hypothetical protein